MPYYPPSIPNASNLTYPGSMPRSACPIITRQDPPLPTVHFPTLVNAGETLINANPNLISVDKRTLMERKSSSSHQARPVAPTHPAPIRGLFRKAVNSSDKQ